MKKFFIPLVLFFLTFQIEAQGVNWITFEKAVELNKKETKPILISVYTDWCGFCKKMEATTYQNKVIIDYINKNFYVVKLNAEQKEDITFKDYTFKYKSQGTKGYNEFAAALLNGKLSYPTTVFMNQEFEILQSIPGVLDAPIMEQVTAYFALEKYKTDKWEDFVKGFKSSL